MAASLYDISVKSYQQVLDAVSGFLEKARGHCETQGVDLDEIVESRLHPDMFPFRFQVASVAHHSLGALEGVKAGLFGPPSGPEYDYAGLQTLIAEARAGLDAFTPDVVEGFAGRDVVFRVGELTLPFVAEDFLMSFSLPNLHFHATTAYDILRMKGVPVGKRDYLGQMRIKG